MSSGWIKMGVHLRTHPKVVRMASALRADRLRVVGGLWAVWCIFDAHTDDGLLEGYTLQAIDDDLGWKGFAAAMQSIGWLEESESGLRAPDYEDHNGPSAKRRASETKRKADNRADAGDTRTKSQRMADTAQTPSGQMSASDADTLRAREDKRREIPPNPRKRGTVHEFPPGFDRVWSVYPRKVGKDAAAKAFAKRKPDAALVDAMVKAIQTQRSSPDWTKDGGQFIPHLATWLNQGRWMDEPGTSGAANDIFAGAR